MKQLFSLIFAGIIGGLVTLGGIQWMTQEGNEKAPHDAFAQTVNNLNLKPSIGGVPLDFKEAAQKAMPAVVHISASESKKTAMNRQRDYDPFRFFFGDDLSFGNPFGNNMPRQGTGSGVIYSEDGYIVTNNHVVEFADAVEVTLYDNRKFNAEVVGTYPQSDLAVLKIEEIDLPTLHYADSDEAEVGEWVLAVGNPFDLTSTVTAGIISAKGRDINIIQGNDAIEAFIQTDAAVNPGNSGGALVDAQGNLLGINTAIATQTGTFSGYSFAIPINIIKRIVDDIIENGSYQRGKLGILIQEIDSELAEELGTDISKGVVVIDLVDGGAAQYAGVLPNDIILKVNGQDVKSYPELQELIGRAKVGETVRLTINRSGKRKEIPVRLKAG